MNKSRGFTLVELLAVIVVLAVILVIAIPNVMKVIDKARLDSYKIDAANIARAADLKYAEDNTFDITTINKSNIKSILNIDGSKYDDILITTINGKALVTLSKDNNIIENQPKAKIYGISYDGNTTFARTDDSVGMTVNIGIDNQIVTNDFDNAEIYNEMIEVTDDDILKNKFIKIPKFYIKKTNNGNAWTYQISKVKQDDKYYLPACFYDEVNKKIIPYVLVGKYDASLSGDGKLESKTNTTPLVNKTIGQFRSYATANNTGGRSGYQILDVHVADVLQTLFYIEFNTLDSQSIMQGYTTGQYTATHLALNTVSSSNVVTISTSYSSLYKVGQSIDIATTQGGRQIATDRKITAINNTTGEITFDGSAVNITAGNMVYNVGQKSGATDSVVASSGVLTANDGKYPMKYRGIENMYGNIWQFVDGINIQDYQTYVSKNALGYTSDVFSGDYQRIGYTNANSNNYVLKMGYDSNNPYVQLPITVTGTYASSIYKDYYYQATGNRIALLGGHWNTGTNAGASYWSLSSGSTNAFLSIGSRLLKTAL